MSGVTYLTTVTFVVFWYAIPVFKEGDKLGRKTIICILAGNVRKNLFCTIIMFFLKDSDKAYGFQRFYGYVEEANKLK